LRYRAEQLKAERQKSGTAPVGEEAKVANADKAFGKDYKRPEGLSISLGISEERRVW